MTRKWRVLAVTLILPLAFLMVSCAKEAVQSQTEPALRQAPETAGETSATDNTTEQASRRQQEERIQAEKAAREAAASVFAGEKIQFDFDSTALTSQARLILNSKAEFLSAYPEIKVIIEGHCDERGTAAYNMALGERRAESVRNYLINLGTSAERLNTVSYGEEKPMHRGRDESAWAKNRRAQFVIN